MESSEPALKNTILIGLALAAAAGCALRRQVFVESAKEARIVDGRSREVLCARTPCQVEVIRLWPYDSSLHYVLLRAEASDGSASQLGIDTHKVKNGERIRFEFPPPAP